MDKEYLVFDARGNGRGGICPTITGDHQAHISDYTAIVLIITDEDKVLHRKEVFRVEGG